MGVYTVSGGTGFLGQHLVQRLAEHGHTVRVVARTASTLPATLPEHLRANIRPIDADVLDSEKIAEAIR